MIFLEVWQLFYDLGPTAVQNLFDQGINLPRIVKDLDKYIIYGYNNFTFH